MNAQGVDQKRTSFVSVFLLSLSIVIGPAVSFIVAEPTAPQLSATGTIASRSTRKSELLPFAITLRNDSASSLSSLRLISTPPGYTLERLCTLNPDEKANCVDGQQFAATGFLLTDAILPGQSFTIWGDLRPARTHKPEILTIIVGWTTAKDDATTYSSSLVVSLGENEVLSGLQRFWIAVSEAVKLLLIPIALAIIGVFLNLFMKKREEVRQEAEQDRTVRAETLKLMLPICHNNASQYYLPLSTALEGMANALRDSKEAVAFFYHLLTWQRMSKVVGAVGGFYFKDLRGEILVAECWKQHKLAVAGKVDDPRYMATRAAIKRLTADSYQAFEREFEISPAEGYWDEDIESAWELFRPWLKDKSKVESIIANLEAFYSVLDYEANRPYQYWYMHVPKLKLTEASEKSLKGMLADKFSPAEVTEYFATVQRA
jgi:hypothetical protein